MGREDGTVTR